MLNQKKCIQCEYKGKMKIWLENYLFPKVIAYLALAFFIIPGVVFIAWSWGKYKCPECGVLQDKGLYFLIRIFRSKLFSFLLRLLVFLCVLFVGSGLVFILGISACSGGVAEIYIPKIVVLSCTSLSLLIYFVVMYHFGKWMFKK